MDTPPNVVIDPVIRSSSGASLLCREGIDVIRSRLLPLARVVTPNLPETEILVGRPVKTPRARRDACRALLDLGCGACVITGGHLEGRPVDLLFDGTDYYELEGDRVESRSTHGTGCTFSAAIAAYLARGAALPEAVRRAKDFVAAAIARGPELGSGPGPVHQLEIGP